MRGSVASFRVSFWWLMAYVMGVATAVAVPLALVLERAAGATPAPAVLLGAVIFAVAGGDVFAFFAMLAYVAYFKVYVNPDGLRACNSWGAYRTVAWSEVLSARPVNVPGLRFLRVST